MERSGDRKAAGRSRVSHPRGVRNPRRGRRDTILPCAVWRRAEKGRGRGEGFLEAPLLLRRREPWL
eukprot:8098739-Pyramimonas_sp.AAC.1